MLRGTIEQIVGKTPAEFSPQYQPNGELSIVGAQERIREVLVKRIHSFEWLHKRLDGEEFWAEVRCAAMQGDEQGAMIIGWRDITERRNLLAALQTEVDKSKTLLSTACDSVHIIDSQGQVVDCSESFASGLGYTVQEALGLNIRDWEVEIEAEDIHPTLDELFKLQNTHTFETRHQTKDGHVLEVELRARPVTVNGRALLYCASRDITARKSMEETLKANEAQLRAVLESSPCGMLLVDDRGAIILVNKQLESYTGYDRTELVGQPIEKLVPAPFTEAHRGHRNTYITQKATPRMMGAGRNLAVLCKDGSELRAEIGISPIKTPEGTVVITTVLDISKRIMAEEELSGLNLQLEDLIQKSKAETRQALAMLNTSDDAAIVCNADTLEITYVNQGAVEQLGYTSRELLNMKLLDINSEMSRMQFDEMSDSMRKGDTRSHRFETTHRHKDGHKSPVEINIQYYALPGSDAQYIVMANDISERLLQQRMTLRSKRLESIGTLAGGVAHDINNAISPIMLSVEMLRQQYPEEPETIETIESCTLRCANMVRQLLSFPKGPRAIWCLLRQLTLFRKPCRLSEPHFRETSTLCIILNKTCPR